MIMTTTSTPTAAGKLNVTCGKRLACTDFSVFFTTLAWGCTVNSVPHTRQRTAFSLRRVPQVGQTFVLLLEEDSIFIRKDYIIVGKEA